MMTVADWIKRLKYLAFNRVTYYDNTFPGNCGEINADGSISFDCINMPKSIINEPDIVYRMAPAGYHVKPGQVIPDVDGMGILGLCTDAKWWDFSKMVPGEFLYMRIDGHGGVYVGEFTHNGLAYNVVECTAAWAGGVIPTYMDLKTGARYQYKGGMQIYAWEAHGKLSRYIDYSKKKLKIDGVWGKKTTAFAQNIYGIKKQAEKVPHQNKSYKKYAPVCSEDSWKFDGSKGWSWLIAAIQIDVGIILPPSHRKYGKFSAATRKALQRRIGVKADGIFGPESVKAFQKYLNKK